MEIAIDKSMLIKVMQLIDEIAGSSDENRIKQLEAELREITGKSEINASDCFEYWSYTSLEELSRTFLMPVPEYRGLSDGQLAEIVTNICEARYSEAENDHQLKVLKTETGISNISDYIYYPEKVGLNKNADSDEITAKIILDKKRRINKR